MKRALLLAPLLLLVACSTASTEPAPSGPATSTPPESQPGKAADSPDGKDSSEPSAPKTPVTYETVTLGFDDLAEGTEITNQYSKYATFSSDPGCAGEATGAAGAASSEPNFLFTYYSCETGETASVFVEFAKPIQKLSFMAVGVNSEKERIFTVRVIQADGTVKTKDVMGVDWHTPVDVSDLAKDVKRLELVNVDDEAGLGFDDFKFDFPN